MRFIENKRVNYKHLAAPPYDPPQTVRLTDMSSALYTALWLIWLNVFILNYYRGIAPPGAVLLRNRGTDIAKEFVAAILPVRFVDKHKRCLPCGCVLACSYRVRDFRHLYFTRLVLVEGVNAPPEVILSFV